MDYVFSDKDRVEILGCLEPSYTVSGVIEACNHCFDDCVEHRVKIEAVDELGYAKAAAIIIMSRIEVPHELS